MNIIVGVTGGIAAYKSVQLVRGLVKLGHDVTVVPTEDALRFVGAPTWEAVSRNPVTTSVHDDVARVRHVALGQAADLVIIAPATANTLARMAAGLADNLLGTTLLATRAPVLVAPAMHTEMWGHPATQANLRTLHGRGVHVIGPDSGDLTGGDSGPGRMSEPEAILAAALSLLAPQDLSGLSVVVSAGGTREPVDPVRYLGNRSSGRQGVALATAAAARGAHVTLLAANVTADVLGTVDRDTEVVRVETAAQLADAALRTGATADVVVMAAAVADYRPAETAPQKLTKEDGPLRRIDLVETVDILAQLGHLRAAGAAPAGQTLVGFAAETDPNAERRRERARRKRARKQVDLIVANLADAAHGFERTENAVEIIGADDDTASAAGSKREVADAVWDAVVALRDA